MGKQNSVSGGLMSRYLFKTKNKPNTDFTLSWETVLQRCIFPSQYFNLRDLNFKNILNIILYVYGYERNVLSYKGVVHKLSMSFRWGWGIAPKTIYYIDLT